MIDYDKYLDGKVLIISGVGRSGTTILGKILGSTKNTFYFFEPAIMKYFPGRYNDKYFLPILFEDYILPAVQGRNLNINKEDWSFYGNYCDNKDLKNRWKLNRRKDALLWIEKSCPLFIFKVNESQYLYPFYRKVFQNLKILEIIRDPIRVVASAIKRGWFTDDYDSIDITYAGTNIPLYVENKYKIQWKKIWNPETRAVYSWCRLNKIEYDNNFGLFNKNRRIEYEQLCLYPYKVVKILLKWLNLEATKLTISHVQKVSKHIDKFDENEKNILLDKIMIDFDPITFEISKKK